MIRTLFLYLVNLLVYIIIWIRNKLYDLNWLHIEPSKIPVISVGNIQMGGAGKTPFVIALTQKLLDNQITPVIITRGYKRKTSNQIIFQDIKDFSVIEVGDEPYYMKQVLQKVPIIIDNNKKRAVKTANCMANVDCIILDDGYQTRYIKKDIDIALVNTWKKGQFSYIMPFGYLREPIQNLKRADFIYTTKGSNKHSSLEGFQTKHIDIIFELIKYDQNSIGNKQSKIEKKENQRLVAFAGIANPKHFFEILNQLEIVPDEKIIFQNHQIYEQENINLKKSKDIIYITTYKDFVKLKSLKTDVYVLNMKFIINDLNLLEAIKTKINEN